MSILPLLFNATLLIYLVASVLYLVAMIGKQTQAGKAGRWVLVAGVVLHAASFGVRHSTAGGTPVTTLHESLSFFAWCLVLLYLLLDLRFRLSVMGAFAAPVAFLLMVGSAFSPDMVVQLNPMLRSWLFPVHIAFAFLGNAAFALSFGAGVMYLIQDRMLKSKRFNGIYQLLPSLDTLDKVNYTCLSVGFPLMTLGIISGAVWANTVWGTYWSWDPKETWALITWFLYAGLLHGRLTVGWRGRRAAIYAIIGFMFLLFTYLGVNLLLGGQHTFDAFTKL
ncbi:cytochrome c-type biogenesis protein CcsB [Malonomonas rubra DSM 5091]|uniref:Heme exporter protein C n=1 Tax=Malonomonas rubra DSM 5091 TaxID=1122189 RepID=A0A1M6FFJ4_MALRU|nr:c-type cytochrome biogenesis protein CcsB [Malonomonas rubra]SHI96500.1 cytochrome c-type biogenesis protein CcsB [Malonomonas rubra DSM 5091]